ncbi:MAG TPA: ADOP family duplicated permease [Gemmatimonadaceae bacterium]|nr:ADOP family duplicated permease [Gemmatimonadaceae bacterium]
MFSDVRYRLRAIFNRDAMDQELEEELSAHIERETEKYVRMGLSRAEAERRARVAFGGKERIKDDARDARGTTVWDSFLQDARYALRGLRSKPGFTAAVLIALGLGVGANTAMFGIVDRLLFRPPAYLADEERIHRIFVHYVWNAESRLEASHSYLRFQQLTAVPSLDLTAAFDERRVEVGQGVDAREFPIAGVSATLFDFFDVRPALGRFFTADEDRTPVGAAVVVLGYDFWQTEYGGARDVIGTTIYAGSLPHTIVGVAPPGFTGFSERERPALYIPITTVAYNISKDYYQNHGWTWLSMYARRRSGSTIAAANADLTTAYQRSWNAEREASGSSASWPTARVANAYASVAPVQSARGPDAGTDARVATWVMGVVVIVLLVACANVANLLLARAASRRRETALRLALGVSTRRLLQQLLTESLVLAALGGALGLALATWGGRVLRALFLPEAGSVPVASDGRTLVFLGVTTLGVALLTGLAPAFAALRDDVAGSLKAGQREGTYRRSHARTALLLFQGALSVVLLVGAGLFVRSLNNVRNMRLGYDVDPVVVVQGRIRAELNGAQVDALGARLLNAALTTPGVQSATLTASIPFGGNEGRGFPFYPGADTARIRRGLRYMLQAGTPQYFATLGTRILRGRGITDADRGNTPPVVIVNQAMADRLWPGEDPLGKQLRVGEARNPYMTVVGVAENMRGSQIENASENWYYIPWEQYRAIFDGQPYGVLVRVNGRAEDFVDVLRRRLQAEMPGNSYVRAGALRAFVGPRQRAWEFGAKMFVAFGALALGLAAIGLYSVVAYAVAQRSHELGVRMALGASVRDVLRMVVGQGVSFAVAGIVIGGVIALWAGKWVQPLLFDQAARDPAVFAIVGLVLIIASVAATIGPAWRATRVDPTVALRSD